MAEERGLVGVCREVEDYWLHPTDPRRTILLLLHNLKEPQLYMIIFYIENFNLHITHAIINILLSRNKLHEKHDLSEN